MEPVVRRAVIAVAIAGVVSTGAFALAQGTPARRPAGQMMQRGPGGPAGRGGMMGLGRVNLTEEQRAAIQKLRGTEFQAHQDTMQKLRDAQRQLRDAIFADNGPDDNAVASAQSQVQALEAQVAANRLNVEKEIAKLLTPDQRKQMRELPAGPGGPGGRGRGMMGRGMGRGMMMHRGF